MSDTPQPPKFPMPDEGWGSLSDNPKPGERFVVEFLAQRVGSDLLFLEEAVATDKLPEDNEDLRDAWDHGPQNGLSCLEDPSLELTGEHGDVVRVRAIAELNGDASITPAYALSTVPVDEAAAGEFKSRKAARREQEARRQSPELYQWLDACSARRKAELETARARLEAMRRPPEPEPETEPAAEPEPVHPSQYGPSKFMGAALKRLS